MEACIIEALRTDECLTTTEITLHHRLLNHFHGMRTLDIRQVNRVLKRMVADGRLESGFHGQGMYTGRNYHLASK